MKEFRSLADFAEFMQKQVAKQAELQTVALTAGAEIIKKEAKDELGHYQSAAGPFVGWAPLTDATQAAREKAGYTPNDPLLASGELRDSISIAVTPEAAIIGSTSDVAVYMENGTGHVPPRPFLGRAAYVKGREAAETMAHVMVGSLGGSAFRPPSTDTE